MIFSSLLTVCISYCNFKFHYCLATFGRVGVQDAGGLTKFEKVFQGKNVHAGQFSVVGSKSDQNGAVKIFHCVFSFQLYPQIVRYYVTSSYPGS